MIKIYDNLKRELKEYIGMISISYSEERNMIEYDIMIKNHNLSFHHIIFPDNENIKIRMIDIDRENKDKNYDYDIFILNQIIFDNPEYPEIEDNYISEIISIFIKNQIESIMNDDI